MYVHFDGFSSKLFFSVFKMVSGACEGSLIAGYNTQRTGVGPQIVTVITDSSPSAV